jgi:hypothetical protein
MRPPVEIFVDWNSKLVFRPASEFFDFTPLAQNFLIVLVDLPVLLIGGIFPALKLVADQCARAES